MNANELEEFGKTAFAAGCSLYLAFMLIGLLVMAILII